MVKITKAGSHVYVVTTNINYEELILAPQSIKIGEKVMEVKASRLSQDERIERNDICFAEHDENGNCELVIVTELNQREFWALYGETLTGLSLAEDEINDAFEYSRRAMEILFGEAVEIEFEENEKEIEDEDEE